MDNGIANRQNGIDNILKLAAQRQIYSDAKTLMKVQIFLSVPVVLLLIVVLNSTELQSLLNLNTSTISVLIVVYGAILAFSNGCIFNRTVLGMRTKAAKIQEDFDCEVLSLPWNEIKCGKHPEKEEIIKNANKYKNKEPELESLKNWYSLSFNTLPIIAGRIMCQRTNCWWDSYLRKGYQKVVIIAAALFFIFLMGLAYKFGNLDLKILTNVIIPFLPALIFTVTQVQDNSKAIKNLKNLKELAETTWDEFLESPDDSKALDLARKFQDEIFDNRKNNPLLFDKFYWNKRDYQEEYSNYSAEKMVEIYSSKNNRP